MFTLIVYKPDSADYCRGCHMASYSADHQVHNFLNAEQLAQEWSEYLYKNLELRINEAGYDFWIFKNGTMVFKESYPYWDGAERYGYNTDEYYEHLEELEKEEAEDNVEINRIWEQAKTVAQKKQDEKKNAELKKQQETIAKLEAQAKEKRLQAYKELQREFGPENISIEPTRTVVN